MSETKTKKPGRVKSALLNWLGVPISLTDGAFWAEWSANNNYSGKNVTVNSALQLSTAWACVRLISETISTLPMSLYHDDGDARIPARDHHLYNMLHNQPNADMMAVVFCVGVVASMVLLGDAFVEF